MLKREHDSSYMDVVQRRKLSSKTIFKSNQNSAQKAQKRVSLPSNTQLNIPEMIREENEPEDVIKKYEFPQNRVDAFKKERMGTPGMFQSVQDMNLLVKKK